MMFEEQNICPYTGLRSFTEEESIYFKGRDNDIQQATKQLEARKFLMLTGASGDGKSSLVNAGIIPNARAGFLKAQYSNWIVAYFRPERNPFRNLCHSLAAQLEISNPVTVEAELSHGFSSLIELYKSSKFYVNRSSEEWLNAGTAEQKLMLRPSANLLILADQFEEFFTNPENYFQGIPSQDSNLTVNLLLETARLALEENLPIYVVCTMRSDYIGQCAAFRGLPEYIGFSQFFVPRLNRKQLQEIIEEPAILSGNQISPRLVERLIHDITEGIDQLPILQHALNQIWTAADSGRAQMDLLHYAMVGGMSGAELPEQDQMIFEKWFQNLPEKIQACYDRPSLQNVLNTHGNKLFASAADAYNDGNSERMPEEDVRHIISNTFVCLTKIDHARAVRNRMSLKEIADITDIKDLTPEKVRSIIIPFRSPGNTLVQPFIDEDGNDTLTPDDPLDISHESLIRNWNLLDEWAHEEYDHVNVYRDFKQQVDRWVENKRSPDYLLPIGPLSYFEDWFNSTEPNKFWINRYHDEVEDKDARLKASGIILENCQRFLKRSARRHTITRTIMRYGASRIAIFFGLLIFLTLSSFYVYDRYSQRDEVVYGKILKDGLGLLTSDHVDWDEKAEFAIEMIRDNPQNQHIIFDQLDPLNSFNLSVVTASEMIKRFENRPHDLITDCLNRADSLLEVLDSGIETGYGFDLILKAYCDYLYLADIVNYFQKNVVLENQIRIKADRLGEIIAQITDLDESPEIDPLYLNSSLEHILNNNAWSPDQIRYFLSKVSPLEYSYTGHLENNYKGEHTIITGPNVYSFSHNGLYQELAYQYAFLGDLDKTLQCIDTLLLYDDGYFVNDYFTILNNATNVATYFIRGDHIPAFNAFVDAYCKKTGLDDLTFMDKLAGRLVIERFASLKLPSANNPWMHNQHQELISNEDRLKIFEQFEHRIRSIGDERERNFQLALLYKQLGLFTASSQIQQAGKYDREVIFPYYEKAMGYYEKLPESFIDANQDLMVGSRTDSRPRRHIFFYPDHLIKQIVWEPRAYYFFYQNGSFLDFLMQEDLNRWYSTPAEINLIDDWIQSYAFMKAVSASMAGINALDYELILKCYETIRENPEYHQDLLPYLKLLLSNFLFTSGKIEDGKEVAAAISARTLPSIYDGFFPFQNFNTFRQVGILAFNLKIKGAEELYQSLIENTRRPVNRSSLLGYVATHLAYHGEIKIAKELILQAQEEAEKMNDRIHPNKVNIAVALSLLPKLEGYDNARLIWKNIPAKEFVDVNMAQALGFNSASYRAYEDIEPLTSSGSRMERITRILAGMRMSNQNNDPVWDPYDENSPWNRDMLVLVQ